MTNIITKVNNIELQDIEILYIKYQPIFEFIKQKEQIPYLVYVFETGINYVKENYNNIDKDWKVWSIVYLKNQFLNNRIIEELDIIETIDNFFTYYKTNYKNYINDLAMYVSEYDRDYGFMLKLIDK